MELFTIQCTTCQVRLKVNNESVIGDILACPKCGSMVQVVPPVGWKRAGAGVASPVGPTTPQPQQAALTASASATVATSSAPTRSASQVAAVPPALPPAAAAKSANVARSTAMSSLAPQTQPATPAPKPAIPAPVAGVGESAAPAGLRGAILLCSTAIGARIKRDWMFLGCGLAGGVLLGAAVWLALGSAVPPPAVTETARRGDAVVAKAFRPTAPDVADPQKIEPATPTEAQGSQPPDQEQSAAEAQSDVSAQSPAPAPASHEPQDDRTSDDTLPGAKTPPAAEPRSAGPAMKLDPVVGGRQAPPLADSDLSPQAADAADSAGGTDSAGAGDSASAADSPAEASPPASGTPPAGNPPPAPSRQTLSQSEIDERLASALPTVEFAKVPLAQFVEFIGDFTNLPITIDERALRAIGKGRQSPVSVKLTDTTAGEALRAAVAKLGLTCAARDGKLVVTVDKRDRKAK